MSVAIVLPRDKIQIMKNRQNNIAYIDGANLHKGVGSFGWKLDYRRFRVWLTDKYQVKTAYLFIGLIPKNKDLYAFLQKCGFTLIFKEVVYDGNGKAKGNCDADLVMQAMRDVFESEFDQSILVTSDGDYAPLVSFLLERSHLLTIISPSNQKKCSILLKRTNAKITYLDDQKKLLQTHK